MARFLNFFPQYSLEDLESLPMRDFQYLVGGMLDLMDPESTEDPETRVNREMRQRAEEAHARAKARAGLR